MIGFTLPPADITVVFLRCRPRRTALSQRGPGRPYENHTCHGERISPMRARTERTVTVSFSTGSPSGSRFSNPRTVRCRLLFWGRSPARLTRKGACRASNLAVSRSEGVSTAAICQRTALPHLRRACRHDAVCRRVLGTGRRGNAARADQAAAQVERSGRPFSPDGKLLAVSTRSDSVIHIFDLAAAKPRLRLQFPGQNNEYHFVFSPDGRRLVSCGQEDDMIRIFDLVTGKQVREFKKPPDFANFLSFSPDGRMAFQVRNLHDQQDQPEPVS